MSRGVLAIFGSVSHSSIDTVISLSNNYNIPFIFWSSFAKLKKSLINTDFYLNIKANRSKRFEKFSLGCYKDMIMSAFESNLERKTDSRDFLVLKKKRGNNPPITNLNSDKVKYNSHTQLYLKPDIKPLLIELIRFYEWRNIYYIYNNEQGFFFET